MTSQNHQNQTNTVTPTKLPPFIVCSRAVFKLVASRYVAIPISLFILLFSYTIDCYSQEINYLSSSGTLIAAIGLILSIKHHYLKNLSDATSILNHYSSSADLAELGYNSPANVNLAISKATDEGVGVILIIFGALVTYFAPLIPLINLCKGA